MASSPVLVSSLESPSGLKTIYGCKENQNGSVQFGPKSSNQYMVFWCIVCSSNEQDSLTSASTVPAPAQDSGSHSVCERQVNCESAGSSFSPFHDHITAWNKAQIFPLSCVKNQQWAAWGCSCEGEKWHNRGRTCDESCCVCVGGGGGDGEVWSGGLSRSGMRSWRSRSPSSAP